MPHAMTDPEAIRLFVEGGRALFTVVSKKTGNRFTYKIKKSKDGGCSFTSVRQGSDYHYIGFFKSDLSGLRSSSKAKLPPSSPEYMGLAFVLSTISQGFIHPQMEFWHEGKCGCCGRTLTDPVSIARGIGPDCWSRYSRRLAA